MNKDLKPGDKITCYVEQCLPNLLVVRFQQNGKAGSNNSTFRGVLIDENSATTKRLFLSNRIYLHFFDRTFNFCYDHSFHLSMIRSSSCNSFIKNLHKEFDFFHFI